MTGVGGVGKTRLAVQVAAELVPNFGDGVWLVELAPVGDPAAVPDAVASALGIIVQAGMTVTASVANALAGRQLLIVLDNCEHVHRCCTTTPAIPFDTAWASYWEANARINAGRPDRCVEILTDLATRTGPARVMGLFGRVLGLAYAGRSGEAMAIADDGLNAARVHANPYWIANAYYGYGRAFTETDPARALDTFRVGLAYTRQHRVPFFEALIARDAAGLEAVHGDLDQALTLFTRASTCSIKPATRPTWQARSPTWPCSSTGSTGPRSPPPSVAPPPTTPPST